MTDPSFKRSGEIKNHVYLYGVFLCKKNLKKNPGGSLSRAWSKRMLNVSNSVTQWLTCPVYVLDGTKA